MTGAAKKWQSIGGLTRAHFPLTGEDWAGPIAPEALLSDNDDVKAIRAVFTRRDGSKRVAEITYLKGSTKYRFYTATGEAS